MKKEDLLKAYDTDSSSIQFSACIKILRQIIHKTSDRVHFLIELRDFILDYLDREN